MLWGCFTGKGTDALQKTDEILKKLHQCWISYQDNDPKQTSKVVTKWLVGAAITKP